MADAPNLAAEFFARLAARDLDGALALTAADFTWTMTGRPGLAALAGTYDRGGFLAMLGRVAAPFEAPPTNEIVATTVTAERIVVESHVVARTKGGVDYENDIAFVFEIGDGKILAVREYLDTLAAEPVFGDG